MSKFRSNFHRWFSISACIAWPTLGFGQDPCPNWPGAPLLSFTKADNSASVRLPKFVVTHFIQWAGNPNSDGFVLGGCQSDTAHLLFPKSGYPFDDTKRPANNFYHLQRTASNSIHLQRYPDTRRFDINTETMESGANGVPDTLDAYLYEYRAIVRNDPAKFGANPPHLDIFNYTTNSMNYLTHPQSPLRKNSPNIQIMNNFVLPNHAGLVTITFPPNWNLCGQDPDGPDNPLPVKKCAILLHGWGAGHADNNSEFIRSTAPDFESDVVRVAQALGKGKSIFAVAVNNGGKEAQGHNDSLLSGLTSFLTTIMPAVGGDIENIITTGTSRAGGEAARWAMLGQGSTSPKLNIRAVFACAAGLEFASASPYSPSTYPLNVYIFMAILGSKDAWKSTYTEIGKQTPMTWTEKNQAGLRIVLGDSSVAGANAKTSYELFRTASIDFLRKKYLHFANSMRDAGAGFPGILKFDRMLTEKGIPHSMLYGYTLGHKMSYSEDEFSAELGRLDNPPASFSGVPHRAFIMPTKVRFKQNPGQIPEEIRLLGAADIDTINRLRPGYFSEGAGRSPSALGFTAVVPYYIIRLSDFEIPMAGEHGKTWRIWARKDNGYRPVFEASGEFGDSGATVITSSIAGAYLESGYEWAVLRGVKLDTSGSTHKVDWFFMYDGREVPNRFTAWVSREKDPRSASNKFNRTVSAINVAEPDSAHRYSFPPKDSVPADLANGVDQIHPLLFESNDSSGWKTINPIRVVNGANVAFVIRDSCTGCTAGGVDLKSRLDPDGDTLRFDIRLRNGGYLTHPSTYMDRGTGYFTSSFAPGRHDLTAFLSDGKGGNTQKDFSVCVGDPSPCP